VTKINLHHFVALIFKLVVHMNNMYKFRSNCQKIPCPF